MVLHSPFFASPPPPRIHKGGTPNTPNTPRFPQLPPASARALEAWAGCRRSSRAPRRPGSSTPRCRSPEGARSPPPAGAFLRKSRTKKKRLFGLEPHILPRSPWARLGVPVDVPFFPKKNMYPPRKSLRLFSDLDHWTVQLRESQQTELGTRWSARTHLAVAQTNVPKMAPR